MDLALLGDLATGGGTLVLAIATFASVRSGNRSARTADRALAAGLRPLLLPSRHDDDPQKIRFGDGHFVKALGAFGAVEVTDDAVYLAANIRNAGNGVAVLHAWHVVSGTRYDTLGLTAAPAGGFEHAPLAEFRRLGRDLYVAGGDSGFWQGAVRDADDPVRTAIEKQVADEDSVTVDLLYGDIEGGQRTITRIVLTPWPEHGHLLSVVRHWFLDSVDPR